MLKKKKELTTEPENPAKVYVSENKTVTISGVARVRGKGELKKGSST
jgi:hypothetical protein